MRYVCSSSSCVWMRCSLFAPISAKKNPKLYKESRGVPEVGGSSRAEPRFDTHTGGISSAVTATAVAQTLRAEIKLTVLSKRR